MKRKYRRVSRRDFYTFFTGIKWSDVIDVNKSEVYVPEKNIHFRLLSIKGVEGSEMSSDLKGVVSGKEDTRFYIEIK